MLLCYGRLRQALDLGRRLILIGTCRDADPKIQDLVYKAMQKGFKSKSGQLQCKACGGCHETDRCYACGKEFQPDWLRKQVEQVNATDGDKPKKPFDKASPPPPSISSWGLVNKCLEIAPPSSSDVIQWDISDVDVEAKSPEPTPDGDTDESLRLHTLRTATDLNVTLGKLSYNLEQSIMHDKPSIQSTLAVLDVRGFDGKATMTVSDYSIFGHDGQVNF